MRVKGIHSLYTLNLACGLADVHCSCISNCWSEVTGSAHYGDKKLDKEAATDKPSGRCMERAKRTNPNSGPQFHLKEEGKFLLADAL